MATVNKDFRVKNGLVVEGTTATVNGNSILTTANTTDNLTEGLSNLYFTDERAQDAFGALLGGGTQTNITVTYDDVNGTVSFIAENGVADSSTDDLTEGSTNLYFTDERAHDAVAAMINGGSHSNIVITYDDASNTLSFVAENGVADSTTDDLAEGTGNLYFTNARALNAVQASYEAYADQAEADAIATAAADATSKANTAESNANTYTDDLIGDVTVDGTTGNTVTDRIATAVSNLVDAAPGTLDTLNELAAALNDDPNFATSITTTISNGDAATLASAQAYADQAEADAIATAAADATAKADAAEADAIATAAADATSKANTAESNANTYTDGQITTVNGTIAALNTNDVSKGTNLYFTDERAQDAVAAAIAAGTHSNITITYDDAGNAISFAAENGVADSTTDDLTEGSTNLYFTNQRAVDALEAVVPNFTEIDINSVATQVAATASLASTTQTAVYSFAKEDYRSAKFVVKAAYSTHTEVSEILITLDTSDNIAITEYAVVGTNGSLGTVTAGINGTDVEVLYTAGTASTDVTVFGTLIA